MLWSQFCNSVIKLYFARHKHIHSTWLNRTGDQTSDCSICWLKKKNNALGHPYCWALCMCVCLYVHVCVCVWGRYGPFGQYFHIMFPPIRIENQCSCMSVYNDDDLLISDAQQRVIDRLVPPSPLLSISAHSSLSTYKSLISSFSAWNSCKLH